MDAISSFFNTLFEKPELVLGALLGSLALIYSGLFRALGALISRATTPILMGYWFYSRADNPNKLNVTLNILTKNQLDIDTIVADRLLTEIYKNHFIAQVVRMAGRRTTPENPLVTLKSRPRARRWIKLSSKTENQLYEAIYNPLISEVSEKTNNMFSFITAIGLPMRCFRFVLALTYEKNIPGRDQHFRCMMIHEDALRALPPCCPNVDHPQYETRFRTLQCLARTYERHPERFGVVKLWLPESWLAQAFPGGGPPEGGTFTPPRN